MATLGSTSKPTNAAEAWGLNSKNQHAVKVTMPSGGPWLITRVGAWFRGWNASATYRLAIWDDQENLLEQSASDTVGGSALSTTASTNQEKDLLNPVQVNGGKIIWVGFWRDPDEGVQFSTRSSGSHRDDITSQGSNAADLTGYDTHSIGDLGAYLFYESANTPPNAPNNLDPSGSEIVSTGTTVTVSGDLNDPDEPDDEISAIQVQVWNDAETVKHYDSGKDSIGGSPRSFSHNVSVPSAHAFYKWRAKTWDGNDEAGPYCSFQRFYANAKPATPSISVDSLDTLTPVFTGDFTDPGDTPDQTQIEVSENFSPFTSKWASGDLPISTTSWQKTYAGTALVAGVAYRVRTRVKDDNGAYSNWSNWVAFTLITPTGPSNNTPRTTNPRLSSLTPTLTVGHSANFRNEEIQVRDADNGGGTQLWYKTWDGADYANTTTKARVYAGTALVYGGRYWWRSRIELSSDGSISEWSAWHPIRINAVPTSPLNRVPAQGAVVTTLTPTMSWDFSDADLDQGDTQSAYELEVYVNSTGVQHGSDLTGTTATSRVYNGTALSYETEYKWRIRVTDAMSQQSAFSAFNVFKPSQPPTATGVSPISNATVSAPAATLDWSFSSPGGKAQYSYRVQVFDKGPTGANYSEEVLVHDTGTIISADTFYALPDTVLLDLHDYRWEVEAKDVDGLGDTET